MAKKKKEKKKHIKLRITIAVILVVLIVTPLMRAHYNYEYNKNAAENFVVVNANGYIQNQPATSVFRYGFNTSDNSGCGWIASFNVLQYLYNNGLYTYPPQIEDVIKPHDQFGTFAFGFLGTNPLVIQLFLQSKGLQTNMVLNSSKFYEKAKESDINIMVYVSKKLNYGHYQMMQYNELTDDFTFYTPNETKTMAEYKLEHKDDFVFMITIKA